MLDESRGIGIGVLILVLFVVEVGVMGGEGKSIYSSHPMCGTIGI